MLWGMGSVALSLGGSTTDFSIFKTDMMKLYARRIELLATKAVTARVWG